MGEFLKQMPKATGTLKQGPAVPERNRGEPATLAEIGITKKESSRAQKLADIPKAEVQERIAVCPVGVPYFSGRSQLSCDFTYEKLMAEREGFEPSEGI